MMNFNKIIQKVLFLLFFLVAHGQTGMAMWKSQHYQKVNNELSKHGLDKKQIDEIVKDFKKTEPKSPLEANQALKKIQETLKNKKFTTAEQFLKKIKNLEKLEDFKQQLSKYSIEQLKEYLEKATNNEKAKILQEHIEKHETELKRKQQEEKEEALRNAKEKENQELEIFKNKLSMYGIDALEYLKNKLKIGKNKKKAELLQKHIQILEKQLKEQELQEQERKLKEFKDSLSTATVDDIKELTQILERAKNKKKAELLQERINELKEEKELPEKLLKQQKEELFKKALSKANVNDIKELTEKLKQSKNEEKRKLLQERINELNKELEEINELNTYKEKLSKFTLEHCNGLKEKHTKLTNKGKIKYAQLIDEHIKKLQYFEKTHEPQPMTNFTGRCWFNAVMQCLFHLPTFRDFIFNIHEKFKKNELIQKYLDALRDPNKIDDLFTLVAKTYFAEKWLGGQDTKHFLRKLLYDFKKVSNTTIFDIQGIQQNFSNLNDYEYYLTSNPGGCSTSLFIANSTSEIQTSFKKYLSAYYITISNSPHILTLNTDNANNTLSFPLKGLCCGKDRYNLCSVIFRSNNHALSLVKSNSGWHLCNDILIEKLSDDDVKKIAQTGKYEITETKRVPGKNQYNQACYYIINKEIFFPCSFIYEKA